MPSFLDASTLDKTAAKFKFLCNVPRTPSHHNHDSECPICQDPYRKTTTWHLGGTVHCPITLPACGHVFGLQCLAKWLLSSDSADNCPLCRRAIVDFRLTSRATLSRGLVEPFIRLETLAMVLEGSSGGLRDAQRVRLLERLKRDLRVEKVEWGWSFDVERVMVAYEEVLNSICSNLPQPSSQPAPPRQSSNTTVVVTPQPPAQVNPNPSQPPRTTTQAPSSFPSPPLRPNNNNHVNLILSTPQIQIALFLLMIAVTYVPTGYLFDHRSGRTDTFTAAVLALTVWAFSGFALLALSLGLPCRDKMVVLVQGASAGIVLGWGVRVYDMRTLECWFGVAERGCGWFGWW